MNREEDTNDTTLENFFRHDLKLENSVCFGLCVYRKHTTKHTKF